MNPDITDRHACVETQLSSQGRRRYYVGIVRAPQPQLEEELQVYSRDVHGFTRQDDSGRDHGWDRPWIAGRQLPPKLRGSVMMLIIYKTGL